MVSTKCEKICQLTKRRRKFIFKHRKWVPGMTNLTGIVPGWVTTREVLDLHAPSSRPQCHGIEAWKKKIVNGYNHEPKWFFVKYRTIQSIYYDCAQVFFIVINGSYFIPFRFVDQVWFSSLDVWCGNMCNFPFKELDFID